MPACSPRPALPAREDVSLRLVSSAGEALPAEIGERFQRHFGVDIVDGIGSTEMLHIFISNRPRQGAIRHDGLAGAGLRDRTARRKRRRGRGWRAGRPLHPRAVRGVDVLGRPRQDAETFQGGWTKSGDKYIRNADGSFTYGGRSDDMLKVSGVYVSPFEVEATLVQHPAVLEAAVIGFADADGLTKTKAFVVLRAGQTSRLRRN